jgi:hypothetical protein
MKKLTIPLMLAVAAITAMSYATIGKAVTWSYLSPAITQQVVSTTTAAATCSATLTGAAGRMTYIEGFDLTGGGATAASIINGTVTGTTNTLNFSASIQAGVTAPAFGTTASGPSIYSVRFPTPIPSSATNTNIVVSFPSFGSGNTVATITVYGFTQ